MAGGVGEDFGRGGRLLERARHAHADEPFFVIDKGHGLAQCREGRDAIDRARSGRGAEHEPRVLAQQGVSLRVHPVRRDLERALARPALGAAHGAMHDSAHLGHALGGNGIGVVPKVEPVHVAVVEPQADLVGMVDALAGPGLERPAARHHSARRVAHRIQRRLLESRGIDVRRERLAVDEDVDAALVFVRHDLDAGLRALRV